VNRQKKEELKQVKQHQSDCSQRHGQEPAPGQQSQQPGQSRQEGDKGKQQEAFGPIDTD
jgi:hypothetical protein